MRMWKHSSYKERDMRMWKRTGPSIGSFKEGSVYYEDKRGYIKNETGRPVPVVYDDEADTYKYFELVEEGKQEEERKEEESMDYSFNVASTKLIDSEEIGQTLTRKNPMVIIEKDGKYGFVIHQSIPRKATLMHHSFKENLELALDNCKKHRDKDGFIPMASNTLSQLISAVKYIKYGPLREEERNGGKITVKFIQI